MIDTSERRVALVTMAHPDDAEFGCGGAVAAWVRDGWEVHYVVCTDAASGGPDEAIDVSQEARRRITELRKAEQRQACHILGVASVTFLDYHDGLLQPTLELRRDLVRLMRQYRPTRVVCQSPVRTWRPVYTIGRHHPDHLAAGEATLAALYPAAQNPWDFPELLAEGLAPHKVREVLVIGAPEPNFAVDITSTIDVKLAALRAHDSQVGARFAEIESRLRKLAADLGEPHGMQYAEVFHRAENA
ncbi:MAG: PIG-L family deacetylase [Chloroflexi bacterium]|nr:PIG-L family deacetylase [Chloroflexota bacterium]